MQNLEDLHPQVTEWLNKIAILKKTVLARLESMPEAQRNISPSPGKRSPSCWVEHLILFEEIIVGSWRQKLLEAPSAKASWLPLIRLFFSKTRRPELEPKGGMSVDELRDRWNAVRERLIAALPEDTQSAWILHPVLGPLSSERVLKMIAHRLDYRLRHWPEPNT